MISLQNLSIWIIYNFLGEILTARTWENVTSTSHRNFGADLENRIVNSFQIIIRNPSTLENAQRVQKYWESKSYSTRQRYYGPDSSWKKVSLIENFRQYHVQNSGSSLSNILPRPMRMVIQKWRPSPRTLNGRALLWTYCNEALECLDQAANPGTDSFY